MTFAVFGLVRDSAATLKRDVRQIEATLKVLGKTNWFVIESDSSDRTVSVLQELSQELQNFGFASLGSLQERFPQRTERIAYCRNYYLDILNTHTKFSRVDYVVVADLDGLNRLISRDAIVSVWARNDWDMCAANQAGPYYDIWALRHKYWNPSDCWKQVDFLNGYRDDFGRNLDVAIFSKMIKIPPHSDWIEVESAFGGFAIYRRSSIGDARYSGRNIEGDIVCEHVPFHSAMKQSGARLFINPALVNAGFTEHSNPLRFRHTLWRNIKSSLLKILLLIMGRRMVIKIRRVVGTDVR